METTEMMLKVFLVVLILLLMVLLVIVLMNYLKQKSSENNQETTKSSSGQSQRPSSSKKSVLNFLEFEKIEDNMIVTKNGRKYIMVIECQGINYDLMSELEKNGVETGFLQFLNALRHPIQLYLQTRTVNLSKSLLGYRERLDSYEVEFREAERKYIQTANDPLSSGKEIMNSQIEYNRKKNVYEYTKDVIQNTERISQNKNVLTRKYYIVISQFISDNKDEKADLEERIDEVFQELYTKAQSIIRSLGSCSVQGKILNSEELIELMYIAYNRDEYDTYGMDKAIQAGYDELYSTGEDAFLKRIKLLDELIEKRAVEKVNGLVEVAKTEKEREVQKRERNIDVYVNAMAKTILDRNRAVIGEDIAEEVSKKLDKEQVKKKRVKEKEGAANVVKKEAKRGRRE